MRARSFGRLAADYDRVRPGYPPAALAGLPPGPVADVGAGTGKLTSVLVGAGRPVVAVEPDPEMRAVLEGRALPGVEVRAGSGERLPVADDTVAAVVYGQAWHWVEPVAAAREARRVLAPGGALALLWNRPDFSVGWVAELNRLSGQPDTTTTGPLPDLDGFPAPTVFETRWTQELPPEDLVLLFSTFSRVSTLPPRRRTEVLDILRDHLAQDPATAGRETVAYPYVCLTLLTRA
ncbi:class I SAM-dependent methyltransferase [Actinomycetospora sp. TBRC 11914]|nr:class I SAM-dependent methyltransferase [Actinomycetospora sp. TBRC 11914]